MSAWSLLVNASKLPAATAWEQLEAIQTNRVIIYGEMEATIVPEVSVEIEQQDVIAALETGDISATLEAEIGSEIV